MNLRQRTFSAVRWTTFGTAIRALTQIVQVAVLARILSPGDYGLLALVTAVLSFANVFSDFGVNIAFVQRRDVTQEHRSSLFWFNVAVSVGLMLIVMVMSPLFASFFSDERLLPLMMISATTFVIGSLGVQVRMSAEKALQFRQITILEVAATLIGFAVALLSALSGWGVYALIMGGITNAFVSTTLAWIYLAKGWRPDWRLEWNDIRSYLGFGGAMVVNNIVDRVNENIDLFLGGKILTVEQLGLYSIPRNLILQITSAINPVITRVAFPLIAEVQNDVARVRSIYLRAMNMTASINAPIYIGLAFFGTDIVRVLLGPGWDRSGVILQMLALWGGLRSLGNPVGSLLYGLGRADLSLKWNLSMLLIFPPVLIWSASAFGPEGMALNRGVVMALLFIPGWLILIRPLCGAELIEYISYTLMPYAIAGFATIPALLISNQLDIPVYRLIVNVAVLISIYLMLSYFFNRSWIDSIYEFLFQKTFNSR